MPKNRNKAKHHNKNVPKDESPRVDIEAEYVKWLESIKANKYKNAKIDESVVARMSGERSEAEDAHHLIEIGSTHIAELAREFYYDPHLMKMIRNRILYELKLNKDTPSELTSELIIGSRRIGDNSEYGIVYRAGFYNDIDYERYLKAIRAAITTDKATRVEYQLDDKGIFVIKADKDGNLNGTRHEYLVGVELNSLRVHHCPYFAYTYCMEDCNFPVFGEKNLISSCVSRKQTGYLVIEAIEGAESLVNFYRTTDYERFVPFMALLFNAQYIAWQSIQFTHGDFHPGNVTVRKIGRNGSAPYTRADGSVIYLDVDEIPAVIDFGTACTTNNPWYSPEGSPQGTPVHDLIRLLGYLHDIDNPRDARNHAFCRTVLEYCTIGLTRGDSTAKDMRIAPTTIVHRNIGEVVDFVETTYKILDLPQAHTPGKAHLGKKYTLTQNRHFALDEILADPSLSKYKLNTITREKRILQEIATTVGQVKARFDVIYEVWSGNKKDLKRGFEVVELGAILNRLYTDMRVKVELMKKLGTIAHITGISAVEIDLVRRRATDVYEYVSKHSKYGADDELAIKAENVSQQ